MFKGRKNKGLLAFVLAGATLTAQAVPSYIITDLGTLGGTNSWGREVNDSGQVVGYSGIGGDSAEHAFVGDTSGLTDLGTLGGTVSLAMGAGR